MVFENARAAHNFQADDDGSIPFTRSKLKVLVLAQKLS